MVGYVSDAIADAIRKWPAFKSYNVVPIRATDGDTAVIDTPLPAIALHIIADEGEGNTFLGGGIRQYFEVQLHCLLPVINYTFTPDRGAQAEILDLSDEAIRCLERTDALDTLKVEHDLNLQFDRIETDTTYATSGANTVTVDVHRVIYKASVEFDIYNKKEQRPTSSVPLEHIHIEEN